MKIRVSLLLLIFFFAIAPATFSRANLNAHPARNHRTFADTIRPQISGVTISNLTSSSVTISWRTNEGADSEVEYGFTKRYGLLSDYASALKTAHTITLRNLLPDTTYYFRVRARDGAGNLTLGRDSTFITPMRSVPRLSPIEITLSMERRYHIPYVEVELTGIFISPTGKELRLQGFWDNGQIWKIRFAPNEAGVWRYRTESNEPDLIAAGRFQVLPSKHRGFVRPSRTRPYGFEYGDGTPFLLMGDTIWDGMSAGVGFDARFKPYINLRAAQGFNAYHAIVVHNRYDYQANEGGIPYAMFTTTQRDYNRLNPDYFKWVDKRVAYADSMGMVSILFFTWAHELTKMSPEDYQRLALYIVARYAAYNVFWVLAGDYQAYFYEPALYRQIGKTVAAADPFDHPISIHPADDYVNREFAKEPWLSYVMHQLRDAGEFLADSIRFDRIYHKPVVNAEYGYHVPQSVHPHHGIRNDAQYIRTGAWSIFAAGGYFVAGFGGTFIDPDGHYEYDPGYDHPPLRWNLNDTGDLEMARQYSVFNRFFREQTNWTALAPHPEMVADDETEMLAASGTEYIAYKARGGRMRLRLPVNQTLALSWFNPVSGVLTPARSFKSVAETVLIMPVDTTDAIAVMRPTAPASLAPLGNVVNLQSEQLNIRQVRWRWNTPLPADSRVELQNSSSTTVQYFSAEYTTEHEIIVDGLIPGLKYQVTIASQAANGGEWKTVVNCLLTEVVVMDRYIEAEAMSPKTTGYAEGTGWNLNQNGSLSTTLTFPQSGVHRLEILARGEYRNQVWPKLVIETENAGKDTLTINTAVFKWFSVKREIATGTRKIKLSFINASNGRQLILDQLHVQFIGVPATVAPLMVNLSVSKLTTSTATLTWKTSKPTAAQVEYKLSAGTNWLTTNESCRDTVHAVQLTELTANSKYVFRIRAKDAAGKIVASRDTTFATLADRQPPVILSSQVANLTASTATIRWTTDENSTSQIEFGLDSTLGRSTLLDVKLVTQHEAVLTNLAAYKTFFARVKSTDAYGNTALGQKFTFMTLPTFDRLVTLSGDGQISKPEKLLTLPLLVKVLNTAGAPMSNASVAFRIISGGGKIFGGTSCANTECVVSTATDGTASARWQVGKTDSQKVEVRLVNRQDLTVQFKAKIDITDVIDDSYSEIPRNLALRQHPNPFRGLTQFEIALPEAGQVSLKIFDLQGREVVTLLEELRSAGKFFAHWNGNNHAGEEITSGMYFSVLKFTKDNKQSQGKKEDMTILKQQLLYLK